ncbi:hypothetical protein [Paenarthrobacter sp. TA1.8]|uniref:hypothetical protein n=1 Tax=Paenarthrobacter sp. TA1.8 TaxID=3400219 RepID=UPI003B42CC02
MTTTQEIRQLLDTVEEKFETLTKLTSARAEELGIDNTTTPVPIGPEHVEIIRAEREYDAAWKDLSTGMDTWLATDPK